MNVLFIIISVILAALVVVSVVAYLKEKTLEEIRGSVYKFFLIAEKKFKESGQGMQKMKWVINQARKLLPSWLQILVTEDTFIHLIQVWFDEIKDLLDDGKSNDSNKGV